MLEIKINWTEWYPRTTQINVQCGPLGHTVTSILLWYFIVIESPFDKLNENKQLKYIAASHPLLLLMKWKMHTAGNLTLTQKNIFFKWT